MNIRDLPLFALISLTLWSFPAGAQECTIGEVKWFAGNFAPRGWFALEGQTLPISSYNALFSILGPTYGGNGVTTFKLPDLRGRSPLGVGSGPGLTPRLLGEQGGSETNTLSVANLPSHNHSVHAEIGGAVTTTPQNNKLAKAGLYRPNTGTADSDLHQSTIGNTGGNQPINIVHPFIALTPIICVYGIYPSRN